MHNYLVGRSITGTPRSKRVHKTFQSGLPTAKRTRIYCMFTSACPIPSLLWATTELHQHYHISTTFETARVATRGCTIQELSALLCRVTQVSKIGIETRPLYYRNLQHQLIRAVHRYGHFLWRQWITYTAEAITHLSWWTSTKSTTEKIVHR